MAEEALRLFRNSGGQVALSAQQIRAEKKPSHLRSKAAALPLPSHIAQSQR